MVYYASPSTLDPLPAYLHPGLIVLATFGLLSFVSTAGAISFIVYRLSNRKKYQAMPLRYNQPLVLILNLLIADLQQATSFVISLHWLGLNAIRAPTHACSAQGWLIQIGDVAGGMFSLAVAMQTYHVLVLRRNLSHSAFVWGVLAIWVFCVLLSLISPILHRNEMLFVSAGAWCWISEDYHDERLLVHHLWIFTCEFGTFILYAITFLVLRHNFRTNAAAGVRGRGCGGGSSATAANNRRVARLMLVYPIAYTCLTLPLAVYRMSSQASHHRQNQSDTFLLLASACMASCGWVDVILYLVARRTIVTLHHRHPHSHHARRPGGTGGVEMNPGLSYGNNTIIGTGGGGGGRRAGRGHPSGPRDDRRSGDGDGDSRGVRGDASTSSSQEGFVKLEQVVEVTIEQATPEELAAAKLAARNQGCGGGNPTYW